MHPATVSFPAVIVTAANPVGVVKGRWVFHIPESANDGNVLAHQPADACAVVVVAICVSQVNELPPEVGEGFVNGPRLHIGEQVRLALRDTMGQLVGHHVVGRREALAVDHLRTVPEGILVWTGGWSGRAVAGG